MNISTCCCLNPLPTSSSLDQTSSSPLLTKNNKFPRKKANDEKTSSSSSWRSKKLMVIATTIVLSLEVGDIISNINGSYDNYSMANEITSIESHIPKKKRGVAKWSDKRSCPPWNMNSLETIVPEDLPRPSAHRKWEEVSNISKFHVSPKSNPSIKFLVKSRTTSCYSM